MVGRPPGGGKINTGLAGSGSKLLPLLLAVWCLTSLNLFAIPGGSETQWSRI